MDTSKPFSTIGYNTESFLVNRLDELKNLYSDLFWCYIYHTDEPNKKEHYHLYIEPNQRIREGDFQRIRESFKEPVEDNEKPLSCMPFRRSNTFEDWYLYALHDQDYLRAKHLQKVRLNYSPELMRVSDDEYLNELLQSISIEKYMSPLDKMRMCHDNGLTMHDAMSYLRIPFSGMYGFLKTWETFYPKKKKE